MLATLNDACQYITSYKIQFSHPCQLTRKNLGTQRIGCFPCSSAPILAKKHQLKILTLLLARTRDTVTVILKVHIVFLQIAHCTLPEGHHTILLQELNIYIFILEGYLEKQSMAI